MKKKIMCLVMVMTLALGGSSSALAESPVVAALQPAATLTGEAMVQALYANEPDQAVRDVAMAVWKAHDDKNNVTSIPTTTGEVAYQLGTFPAENDNLYFLQADIVGHSRLSTSAKRAAEKFPIIYKNIDWSETEKQKNMEALTALYQDVMSVRMQVAGKNQVEALRYVYDHVMNLLSYSPQKVRQNSMTDAFTIKVGVCENYTSLMYLYTMNCGIELKVKIGKLSNGSHAWNEVTLDGKDYVIDATSGDATANHDYFFLMDKNQYYSTYQVQLISAYQN